MSKQSIPCKYCGRVRKCTPESHEENPFCNACLHERVQRKVEEVGPITHIEYLPDGYVVVRRATK